MCLYNNYLHSLFLCSTYESRHSSSNFEFKRVFDSTKLDLFTKSCLKSILDYFFPRNVESLKRIFYLKLARAIFADSAVITRMYQQT